MHVPVGSLALTTHHTMPFKYDANGQIVLADHNGQKLPVFIHADGKEAPFDADGAMSTISARNAEAKTNRERAEAAEKALKPFTDAGITDVAAAVKALATVKNLDEKKLVDAGERDRAIAEAVKAVEEKFAPIAQEREALTRQLYDEKIGGAFARSKFISEKVAVPVDMVQATFGQRFKIEDGKVVAYGVDGNKLYSRTNPGNPADFDEALQLLVEQYPHSAAILKGSGASGSGATGGGGGGGGKRTITRAQFDALDPAAKAAAAKEQREGKAVITD